MKHKIKELNKGFTFIEVIVAIFVMSIGIVGTLLAVQSAISSTTQSYSRLTAAYLAQEGIEIVRNIRDGNWLEQRTVTSTPWDEGSQEGVSIAEGEYEIDYNNYNQPNAEDPELKPYDGGHFLRIDPINGFYNYNSGDETQFKRRITIEKPEDYILKVLVTVYWGGGEHSITAQENLYRWH